MSADRGPVAEAGTITGNVYDKYGTRNPIARRLMRGFFGALTDLASRCGATDAHEVGCGEGHLAIHLAGLGWRVRGSDVGHTIIERARAHAAETDHDIAFRMASIYDLEPVRDGAPLVVCCEVLEHLEEPERARDVLAHLAQPWLLASVPREPIWRLSNIARGSYLRDLGNTPGHLNHWSRRGFLRFLGRRFEIVAVRSPFPWTMALCRARSTAP